jgi:dolichyl-phosphate-mannose-protein mannosyltransferase
VAIALVLIVSAGLRLFLWRQRSGPLWFEEAVPVVWAQRLWGFDRGHFDLNPHSALWPHLSAYYFFLVQLVQYAIGLARGAIHGTADFRAAAFLDPTLLRGGAMLGEIVVALCAIAAAWRLATRLAGEWMGLAVALVLALEPLHVRYSLVPGPDMLLALFVTLALLAVLDVLERGRHRDSLRAGIFTGLGIATKYSPALLLLPLALAHSWSTARARSGRFATCVAAAFGAFVAGSPFSLVDLVRRREELGAELSAFAHGPFGQGGEPAALAYLLHIVPADLGWPLMLLAAAGAIAAAAGRSRPGLVLLAWLLPFALILGAATSAFERYLLPVMPVLLAFAAIGLREGLARRTLRPWVFAAAVASLAWLAGTSVSYVRTALSRDSRALAREWFMGHVMPRSLVALEPLGPDLPDQDDQAKLEALPRLSPGMRARLEAAQVYSIAPMPMSVHDPDAVSPFYVPRDLAGFDAVAVSGSVRARYLAEPARFPVQVDFYQALDRFWSPRYRTPADAASGPEVTVYAPDSTKLVELEAWWAEHAAHHGTPMSLPQDERIASTFADRATRLTRAGRFGEALRLWPTALRWEHAPGQWWYAQGLALAATDDRHGAYIALREAHRRDPGLLAAEIALMDGALEDSRRALEEVTARDTLSASERARADSLTRMLSRRPR